MANLSSMSRTRSSSVLPLMPSAAIDASLCAERPDIIRKDAAMSLSRDFAAFVANLRYGDLPAAVVDRAKGVTLQALSSALLGSRMPASRQALALIQEEEAGGGGAATVLCHGAKLTKAGAAFANAETIFAGGKWDTFRMLTHPGIAILPAALAAAETSGCSGRDFLTGIAAGYEVMERMAAEFIPTVMSRGFHAGPVFGIFGAAIAAAKIGGLGRDWMFLETLYRIYSTAGYNIAHVDVTARLCEEHDIRYEHIERIEAVVNWLETEYPSPAFPSRGIDIPPKPGSTQYFTAYGAVARGYPLLRGGEPGPGDSDPPEVLDLMQRVTLIPTMRRTLFGPRITIFTNDGRSFTKEGTGREFIWDFEEEARRIRDIAPGVAIGDTQFAALIDACRHLDTLDDAATRLISLTIPR